MQIKVTLDELNYKRLKECAKMNRRTFSAELNTILDTQFRYSIPIPIPDSEIETIKPVATIEQIKKCADTLNLSEDDTSLKAFSECRTFMERILGSIEMTKELFDEAQEERRNDLCKSKSPSQKKTIID